MHNLRQARDTVQRTGTPSLQNTRIPRNDRHEMPILQVIRRCKKRKIRHILPLQHVRTNITHQDDAVRQDVLHEEMKNHTLKRAVFITKNPIRPSILHLKIQASLLFVMKRPRICNIRHRTKTKKSLYLRTCFP